MRDKLPIQDLNEPKQNFWNPFRRIQSHSEGKVNNTRFIFSSFWTRVKDTYSILTGPFILRKDHSYGTYHKIREEEYGYHRGWGVLDYTFPLFRVPVINLLKFAIGGLLTIALSPVILLVHIGCKIYQYANKSYRTSMKSVEQLTLTEGNKLPDDIQFINSYGKIWRLYKYKEGKEVGISNSSSFKEANLTSLETAGSQWEFQVDETGRFLRVYDLIEPGKSFCLNEPNFRIAYDTDRITSKSEGYIDLSKEENIKAVKAMQKFNLFGFKTWLENTEQSDKIRLTQDLDEDQEEKQTLLQNG